MVDLYPTIRHRKRERGREREREKKKEEEKLHSVSSVLFGSIGVTKVRSCEQKLRTVGEGGVVFEITTVLSQERLSS